MNNKENNAITIIAQAFYGNMVVTRISTERLDNFILGHLDDFNFDEPVDRTIIGVPNVENLFIIYNKYKEEEELQRKEELLKESNYVLKPLAVIPELNLEIFSRCIVCRMNENGEFEDLREDDFKNVVKYLAE